MDFKINGEMSISLFILMVGYVLLVFSFAGLFIEYVMLDFSGEVFRAISASLLIVTVGAYLKGKDI